MSAYTVEPPVPARPQARPPGHRFRLVVGIVVLTVTVLVVTDRLLVRIVEHRLATRLACLGMLSDGISVHIGGFPFLAEVAAGHISSARVTAGAAGPGARLVAVTIDLRDLRLPPMAGLVGSGGGAKLAIGSATLGATVPYGTLRDLIGAGAGAGAGGLGGGVTPRTTAAGTTTSATTTSATATPEAAGGGMSSFGGLPFGPHLDA
ncbi:LmeA family phospholipid-binding protein, partial [Candidatus Frankia nodulisporulans]|uniref:LmeA family phospholipid-binding protein n=1 Tax=Candidatus Frankia nodulisporulans TaxID=2060052 RepID=UPI003703C14D